MRFALIGPTLEENLALGYLAAALRAAGHEATFVPFEGPADTAARAALAHRPDAVGVSLAFQVGAEELLGVPAALRARGFAGFVVAGGAFASLAADDLLREAPALDAVLCGEADESIVRLADALQSGTGLPGVPGLVRRDGGSVRRGPRPTRPLDLDALPLPARDTPTPTCAGVPAASVLASRGCRGRCSFCSLAAFAALSDGPVRRERSPEGLAHELAELWRTRGARFFVFQDDDFLGGAPAERLARAVGLERALAAEGLPPVALAIKARPDGIDRETLRALHRAGLVQVFLGVETVSSVGLRAFARGVGPERVRAALDDLRSAGVFVASNLLLWRPDGTLDELRENLALLAAYPDQPFNFGRAEPYEGSALTRRLAREGRLLGDWRRRDYELRDAGARRSFELFAATLGRRCGERGAIPLAQRVGTAAAVAERLFGAERTAALAGRARTALGRLADSNRRLLAGIVEAAATGDRGQAAATGRLATELEAADAVLVPELRGLLARLEECAAPPRRRAARRSAWSVPARAAAVAAAGALACAQPQPAVVHPEGPGVAGPQGPDASGAPDPDVREPVEPAAEPIPGLEVRLTTDHRYVGGGPCRPATPQPSAVAVTVTATLPQAAIEGLEADGGRIERLVVAPDGSRAVATVRAGEGTDDGRVVVRLRLADGSRTAWAEPFWWANGYAFAVEEQRTLFLEPEPPFDGRHGMGCDPPGPMPTMRFEPRELFAQEGRVAAAMHNGRPEGWATPIRFAVGVTEAPPDSVEPLEATCELGQLEVQPFRSEGEVFPPGWFLGTFSPYGEDGRAMLREGSSACTVSFRVRGEDGETETLSLRLGVTVAADGTVTLGPAL
ncbi:MAG: radical SAM protein [Deltaproteobacteria bacterium]|nr:radical SAM protein [Deltaproteobacteria bacterium]